jgi:hypothetical protein
LQHMMGHILVSPQRYFCHYYIGICQKERYIRGYGYLVYLIISTGSILRNDGYFVYRMVIGLSLVMTTLLLFVWMWRRIKYNVVGIQGKL